MLPQKGEFDTPSQGCEGVAETETRRVNSIYILYKGGKIGHNL